MHLVERAKAELPDSLSLPGRERGHKLDYASLEHAQGHRHNCRVALEHLVCPAFREGFRKRVEALHSHTIYSHNRNMITLSSSEQVGLQQPGSVRCKVKLRHSHQICGDDVPD